MTKTQAMNQKCKCGKFLIGGWVGYPERGRPNFSRMSCPQIIANGLVMCAEHTFNACYSPKQIA